MSKPMKTAKAPAPKASRRGARARAKGDPLQNRERLVVMVAAVLVACSIGWVFMLEHVVPWQKQQEAQEAVWKVEKTVLEDFRLRADRDGTEILGWETQVFPRITLVTYVYRLPNTSDRKAFWWAYTPSTGKVERVKSVAEFVDAHLLPTVDQLHSDVTGVPGPLARVRHQNET